MIVIIKKNLGKYLFAPALLTAWTLVYGSVSEVNNLVAFSNLLSIMLFFGAILPAVMIEADEEKYKGYQFLATLPVTLEKVVRAKGLMMLVLVLFVLLVDIVFISFTADKAGYGIEVILPSISRIVFGASVCLLLGGMALIALYRFGTYVVLASFGVITFLINLGTFFLFKKTKEGVRLDLEGGFLSRTEWYHLVPIFITALIAYHFLLRGATRVKAGRRV